jgi:hypothetical protein
MKTLIMADTRPLTPVQRAEWLVDFTNGVSHGLGSKFLNGAKEHGGDIGNVPTKDLLLEMLHELYDALSYWGELQRRFSKADVIIVSRETASIINTFLEDQVTRQIGLRTTEEVVAIKQLRDLLSGKAETGI